MKLYYHPLSTYSRKALVALYEKGVDFESEIVQLMDADAREAYRAVYPLGKIPMLMLDDGYMIPESTIIIEYLDGGEGTELIHGDADSRRKIRFKDRMLDNYVNDSVSLLFFQSMKPEEQRDAERIETARFRLHVLYEFLDQDLADSEWICGDRFSMADCAAAAAFCYAAEFAPMDGHPNVARYWERLRARDSVARVEAEAAPYLEAMLARQSA